MADAGILRGATVRYEPEEPLPNVRFRPLIWAPPENAVDQDTELVGGPGHGKIVPREWGVRAKYIRCPIPTELSYSYFETPQLTDFLMEQGFGWPKVALYLYDRYWNRAFYVGEEDQK